MHPIETNNEKSILKGCLVKQPRAQRALYDKYALAMYNTIIRMVPRRMEAEDVLQESFVKVFQSISDFRGASTLGTWIKSICINTSLKHLRTSGNITFLGEEDMPEKEIEAPIKYDVTRIHEAIKSLPRGARTITSLYLIEGYTHAEIARIMDVSESTSKSQYNRAKKILAQKLKGMIHE